MGRFLRILLNVLLVLIIVVLLAYFILRATDTIRIYNVETGSMEDKIHTGDYILLYKADEYKVGDVVTYRVSDYFITHRIIKIEDGKITTKGDANNIEDAEATLDQIEGKAIYWGGVLNFVINFKFVIAAFLVGLYLLSCYFEDGKEEIEEKKDVFEIDDQNEDTKEEIKEEIIIEEIEEEPLKEVIAEEIKEEIREDAQEEKVEVQEEIKPIEIIKEEEVKPKKKTTRKKKTLNEEIKREEEKEEIKPKKKKTNTTKKNSSSKRTTKKSPSGQKKSNNKNTEKKETKK